MSRGGELVDLAQVREARNGTEPWITKQEVARHLGFSVRWVEYRIAEGLPHRRMGGRLRFQRTAVERWLSDRGGRTA
jgi:excisionase family DNA binding protein